MKRSIRLVSVLWSMLPGAASAQTTIEILIAQVDAAADGGAQVDIRLLNTGTSATQASLPDSVEARLERPGASGTERTVMLQRARTTPAAMTIAPGNFASAHYRLAPGNFQHGALLSVAAWGEQALTLAEAPTASAADPSMEPVRGTAPHTDPQVAAMPQTPPPSDRTVGNAFLENLSAYEPIYAVYGSGTNSEARLQLSFKYQLFGSEAREGRPALEDGFYFAYTQRMFWALGSDSSPFRNIDFQPEVFYVTPAKALSERTTVSAQIGMRHESNGRAGDFSRSLNTVYIAPMAAFSLAGGMRLRVVSRAWFYAGDLSDNRDIRRYRGNTGLLVEIGENDGLRLSTSSRFNFGSGKGSIAADLSYPLRRILGGGPDVYLFGQTFLGYGENLLDYNNRTKRLRIGVALVR